MGSPPESYVQGAFSIAGSGIPRPDRREIRFHTKVVMALRRRADAGLTASRPSPFWADPCAIEAGVFSTASQAYLLRRRSFAAAPARPTPFSGALARVYDIEQKS
jgi:hypothetical protein